MISPTAPSLIYSQDPGDLHPTERSAGESNRDDAPRIDDSVKAAAEQSGILAEHLVALQEYAAANDLVLGFRPVERVATGLIASDHPTKNFHIKGKSSNWGPQAGFICVDQAYSKMAGRSAEEIEQSNATVGQCIRDGHACAVDLSVTRERLFELRNLLVPPHALWTTESQNGEVIRIGAQAPDGKEYVFTAQKRADGCYSIFGSDGRPLKVLAPSSQSLAFTADYDLLVVGPSYSDFGSQDNIQNPDISYAHYRKRSLSVINGIADQGRRISVATLWQCVNGADANAYHAAEDPHIGNATPRIRKVIQDANEALARKQGLELVHHSMDAINPATNEDANYPATILLPRPIGERPTINIVHDRAELVDLYSDVKEAGYHMPVNPLWGSELTSSRRPSYSNALTVLGEYFGG